jgi:putative FmdB family regulatory protein
MPSYDYRCGNCGHRETVVRPMSQAGDVVYCPEQCTPFQPMQRVYEATASAVKGGTPIHHDRAWLRGPGGQGNSVRRGRA